MMKPLASLVALSASILVAGCTVGPNFERPAAPKADGYRSSSDPAANVAGAPQARIGTGPTLRWWEAFGSSELDAFVDQAIANNQSLEASKATLARSQEIVHAAAGGRLPQVDANARVEREEANLAAFGFQPGALPGLAGNPVFNLFSVGGGVSFNTDLFGGVRRTVEQRTAEAEAQRRETEAAHLTLAGQVVNQVLTIAAIREEIATANALLAEDQQNVDLTEKRRKAGEGTLVEVLNAQSQLAADRADLPQLSQQLAEGRHLLATLIGVAPADLGPTEFNLADLTLPSDIPVAMPSELVHKRPDILQAEEQLHAATAAIGVATARLYPNLTLGATLTQGSPHPEDIFSSAFRGYDIFAALSAPIFHGGTLKAERRAAVDEARAAAATYQTTVIDAFRQVADLLSALQSDAGSVAGQQEAVSVAERSLHLSRRSFQVGNSGILQVLESERLYQRARGAWIEARARQYVNVARLYVATAGGWIGPAETAQPTNG